MKHMPAIPDFICTAALFIVAACATAAAQAPAPAAPAQTPTLQGPTDSPPPGAPPQVVAPVPPLAIVKPPEPTTSQNNENSIVLLDRIQAIVDEALGNKPKSNAAVG